MLAPAFRCSPIEGGTTHTAPRCNLHHRRVHNRVVPHALLPRFPPLQPLRRVGMSATNSTAGAHCRCQSTSRHTPPTGIASTPSPAALQLWKDAQAVCFDVDSTLCVSMSIHKVCDGHCNLPRRCEDESIDEIAAFLGVGEQVAALTARYGWLQQHGFIPSPPCFHPARWEAVSSFRMPWLPD